MCIYGETRGKTKLMKDFVGTLYTARTAGCMLLVPTTHSIMYNLKYERIYSTYIYIHKKDIFYVYIQKVMSLVIGAVCFKIKQDVMIVCVRVLIRYFSIPNDLSATYTKLSSSDIYFLLIFFSSSGSVSLEK